jgi:carboxypeptidase T
VFRRTGQTGRYPSATDYEQSWLELASQANAVERVIGRSRRGRPLRAIEIGSSGAPVVLLTGLIHGIELIGSMALRGFAHELMRPDGSARDLLDRARFIFVPIVNPDAFADNMERVVRGRRAFRRCNDAGVDLNRNFATPATRRPWHPFAGSRFRFAPHYAGPSAFSEPETRALRDLIAEDPPEFALGFHSFGELLLYPWGHTRAPNPRRSEYEALGQCFARALPRRAYAVRQACDFYPTLGDLDDWLDSSFGTLAFTVEVGHLDAGLFEPERLSNPFFWHNPRETEEATGNVVPGVVALLRAACTGEAALDADRSERGPRHPLEKIAAR